MAADNVVAAAGGTGIDAELGDKAECISLYFIHFGHGKTVLRFFCETETFFISTCNLKRFSKAFLSLLSLFHRQE